MEINITVKANLDGAAAAQVKKITALTTIAAMFEADDLVDADFEAILAAIETIVEELPHPVYQDYYYVPRTPIATAAKIYNLKCALDHCDEAAVLGYRTALVENELNMEESSDD